MNNKILTVVSLCILALVSVSSGGIVKSNVGGREIGFIAQEEDNPIPYITDGLIAMWDGEWNTGVGIHDDSATVWKDLTGNRSHDFILVSGNYVWEDKALFGLERSTGRLGSLNISSLGEVGTIECVVNPGYGHDNVEFQNGIILEGAFNAGTIVLRVRGYASRKCCQILSTKHNVPFYSTYGYGTRAEDRIISYGATIEGNETDFCFLDGFASQTYRFVEWFAQSSFIILGAYRISDERYPFYGPIYCIRIYSRKLSSEEIAYNFQIDQERFGIE